MAQMKEQNKTPEKELNEMEITNLSDAEFKIGLDSQVFVAFLSFCAEHFTFIDIIFLKVCQ